jgi:hypothetical protein
MYIWLPYNIKLYRLQISSVLISTFRLEVEYAQVTPPLHMQQVKGHLHLSGQIIQHQSMQEKQCVVGQVSLII